LINIRSSSVHAIHELLTSFVFFSTDCVGFRNEVFVV